MRGAAVTTPYLNSRPGAGCPAAVGSDYIIPIYATLDATLDASVDLLCKLLVYILAAVVAAVAAAAAAVGAAARRVTMRCVCSCNHSLIVGLGLECLQL